MELGYSAVFSNLAKACEKQFRSREAELCWKISGYFDGEAPLESSGENAPPGALAGARVEDLADFVALCAKDESTLFAEAKDTAEKAGDRGALRMAVWGGKVNTIQKSVAERATKQGDALLQDKSIFVCEACGFIFIGQEAPEVCPVCKAPGFRFAKIS